MTSTSFNSFDQFIQYKTLHSMYSANNDLLMDVALADPRNEQAIKAQLKNVCAMVSKELFDDLENVCNLLDISKRQFIEYALIEAIEKSKKIIEQSGFYERFASDRGVTLDVVEDEETSK